MNFRFTYCIFILFFLINCKRVEQNEIKINQNNIPKIVKIENDSTEKLNVFENKPAKELIEFVKEIEKLNWVPDTLRLKEKQLYTYLKNKEVIDGYPFYKIDFVNTDLKNVSDNEAETLKKIFPNFDIGVFRNSKDIWGYYYKDKNGKNIIIDGVIEQWVFTSEVEAQNAFKQMEIVGDFVYFNTMPYFCNIRNYLFVFRTRAMMFSYDQKVIFEKFKNKYCT